MRSSVEKVSVRRSTLLNSHEHFPRGGSVQNISPVGEVFRTLPQSLLKDKVIGEYRYRIDGSRIDIYGKDLFSLVPMS